MALAAIIGANVIGGIGSGVASGLIEGRRQHEFDQNFNFRNRQFDFQADFANRQLKQQNDIQTRGQSLSFLGGLTTSGFQAGSSLIGNILNYSHGQDQLNFAKEQNQQRRDDLTAEGIPLSYLHVGSSLQRSIGSLLPMNRQAGLARSEGNPWGFANSGPNLRETYQGTPPPYSPRQNISEQERQNAFDQLD